MNRIFAQFDSGRPGPLIIVVVALHGNEHVGLHASNRLLSKLKKEQVVGKVVVILGNHAAAHKKQRFIHQDLNRFFVSQYLNEQHSDLQEWHEARDLIDAIESLLAQHDQSVPAHLLDMHSMSGEGIPFTCFPHTAANEEMAHALPLPAIAGMVEFLPGTLTEYFASRFNTTMVVECGQHDAPESIDTGVAAMTAHFAICGVLQDPKLYESAVSELEQTTCGYSKVFTRVNFRYHIEHREHFAMEPGFENLQLVEKDVLLAKDNVELVYTPYNARVVLPCYQKQGDDGFFLALDED